MKFPLGPRPSLAAAPSDEVLDLGKERELRDLRKKVTELETRLSVREGRPIAGVVPRSISEERHGYKCGFHPQVEVSDTTPEVTCTVCDEVLDPITVLRQFAQRERNFIWGIDAMIKEEKLLKASVEALRREKKNLMAGVRRAGGKPAEIVQKAEMAALFGKDPK